MTTIKCVQDLFPNKYFIDFDLYFNKLQSPEALTQFKESLNATEFFSVLCIPAKKNGSGKVIPLVKNVIIFQLESMLGLPKNERFFLKTASQSYDKYIDMKVSFDDMYELAKDNYYKFLKDYLLKSSPERIMDVLSKLSHVYGYDDLVIGYYDNIKEEFVQEIYLENFYKHKFYDIMDLYMFETKDYFYYNEDFFERKIATIPDFYSEVVEGYYIENKDLQKLIHKLKLTCLEASFDTTSLNTEVLEMHDDIYNEISKLLPNNSESEDFALFVELSIFLRSFEVVDIYVKEMNVYKEVSKLKNVLSKTVLDGNLKIVYHERLIKILEDKWG